MLRAAPVSGRFRGLVGRRQPQQLEGERFSAADPGLKERGPVLGRGEFSGRCRAVAPCGEHLGQRNPDLLDGLVEVREVGWDGSVEPGQGGCDIHGAQL